MERYSSAVESKSRKDYLEMTRHWLEDGPEAECFREAEDLIGAPGFRIRDSASYASARYSGVFCLLALRNARDWRRGEDIRLQELQDHHIFPKEFLKRHDIAKRVDVNTIANRTLISDETNGKIKDKAPGNYVSASDIFPSGANGELLEPHFIGEDTAAIMETALEGLADEQIEDQYQRFVQGRQAAIIEEIRRVCGITPTPLGAEEETEEDEVAADVKEGTEPSDEALETLEAV